MENYDRTVLRRVPKTYDIEIHFSRLTTSEGDQYTDIREYVLSLDRYGRGITFPSRLEPDLLRDSDG